MSTMSVKIGFLFGVLLLLSSCGKASVTYDHRAISIIGQRKILISGAIHYPRSTPEMWPDLIQKAKKGGLDVIETYVFWNGHEPQPGKYYFEGRYDLVKFIKLVQDAGLYVNLRIGPYVCAEWNFGGFPVWLKYVPGISFRTDNGPFKAEMQRFTAKIVNMMKAERLYESQGGPIILSQEVAGLNESVQKSAQLALDEDDFQTVTVENKLGCDVYLKKREDDSDMISLIDLKSTTDALSSFLHSSALEYNLFHHQINIDH